MKHEEHVTNNYNYIINIVDDKTNNCDLYFKGPRSLKVEIRTTRVMGDYMLRAILKR